MVSKDQLLLYTRDGFKNVCNHVFMSFSSILTLIITLSLCAVGIMFVENTNQITRNVESQVTLIAEFQEGTSAIEIARVMEVVANHELVEAQDFIDRYTAREVIVGELTEDERVEQLLLGTENLLFDVLEVETIDIYSMAEVSEFLGEIDSIRGVVNPSDVADAVSGVTTVIRVVVFVFVVALMILTVFLVQNTIRVTIYARLEELTIMKLVGASIGHIVFPFVFEGLIIGAIGAIVPIVFTMVGYYVLYNVSGGIFALPIFELAPAAPLVYIVSFNIGLISIGVSLVGSIVAVMRYALKE